MKRGSKPRTRDQLVRKIRSLQSNLCITRKKAKEQIASLERKIERLENR
jgi:hypothetical protein